MLPRHFLFTLTRFMPCPCLTNRIPAVARQDATYTRPIWHTTADSRPGTTRQQAVAACGFVKIFHNCNLALAHRAPIIVTICFPERLPHRPFIMRNGAFHRPKQAVSPHETSCFARQNGRHHVMPSHFVKIIQVSRVACTMPRSRSMNRSWASSISIRGIKQPALRASSIGRV